jgi:hypothetical protein
LLQRERVLERARIHGERVYVIPVAPAAAMAAARLRHAAVEIALMTAAVEGLASFALLTR